MSLYSSQIVLSTPQLQFKQGTNFGRVIGQPAFSFMGNSTQSQGIISPMMRSNLSVQQLPSQRQSLYQHDLKQFLVSPQKIQQSHSQQPNNLVQNPLNRQSFIQQNQSQKVVNPGQINSHTIDKMKNHQINQRNPSINFQQPIQSNRIPYESKEIQNQQIQKQQMLSDRILNRNLSPQPTQRFNSPIAQQLQRAVSPQSARGSFVQSNPQFSQTLYQPSTRFAQSPQHQRGQRLVLNNRNSFSSQPRIFYQNQQETQSKQNSHSIQMQSLVLPYKLELPLNVRINQQRMNEAIERSEKIKKLVAEKQLQMKQLEQNRQEYLDVSKLHEFPKQNNYKKLNDNSQLNDGSKSCETSKFLDVSKLQEITPLQSISKLEMIQSPFKTEQSQISLIQNKTDLEKTPDQMNVNKNILNPDSHSVANREITFSNNLEQNNQSQSNLKKGKAEYIEHALNQITQNQIELKKIQQEFKQSAKNLTEMNQFNTPINNEQKSTKQDQEQNENKENSLIATPISIPQSTNEVKPEFKSTINQFKRSFQNSMYSTPINNKKKFQKKIQINEDEYQGGVENEVPNGYGILKDKQGQEIYKGDWKNGQYDGSGILANRNSELVEDKKIDYNDLSQAIESNSWIKYEGDMSQNKIQGFGTIYFKQNQKFVGNLSQGIPNGQGSFYNKDGNITTAIWENGKLMEIL